nr:MAG TPA: 4Fe-4S dicluster domain protein [Caudoviricetes sp.]
MKCDRCHACVSCVYHHHTHTVDAMRTEMQRGSNIHLVRRRMTGTIRNILVSDSSELVGRNFLIVAPVNDGHSDVSVIHVTADNINIVRGMATNADLDIYELIVTEE